MRRSCRRLAAVGATLVGAAGWPAGAEACPLQARPTAGRPLLPVPPWDDPFAASGRCAGPFEGAAPPPPPPPLRPTGPVPPWEAPIRWPAPESLAPRPVVASVLPRADAMHAALALAGLPWRGQDPLPETGPVVAPPPGAPAAPAVVVPEPEPAGLAVVALAAVVVRAAWARYCRRGRARL